MIRICILLYGLSITEAYTVKVTGKVELGSQLSKLVKDLYSQLVESGLVPAHYLNNAETGPQNPGLRPDDVIPEDSSEFRDIESDGSIKVKKHKKIKGKRGVEESHDIPVLNKMMNNDLEKLHLYGYNKSPDKSEEDLSKPLNNVNI